MKLIPTGCREKKGFYNRLTKTIFKIVLFSHLYFVFNCYKLHSKTLVKRKLNLILLPQKS